MSNGFRPPEYTMVPDVLFDKLLPDLSEAELKVLLYIIRRTFGFKKMSDQVSLSQMANGIAKSNGERVDLGTGLAPSTCSRAAKKLEQRGLIYITPQEAPDGGAEANLYTLRFKSIEQEPQGGGIAQESRGVLLQDQPQYTVVQDTDTNGASAPATPPAVMVQQVVETLKTVEHARVGGELVALMVAVHGEKYAGSFARANQAVKAASGLERRLTPAERREFGVPVARAIGKSVAYAPLDDAWQYVISMVDDRGVEPIVRMG